MFYELNIFYKRDTYFWLDEQKNGYDYLYFLNTKIDMNKTVFLKVDKIDSYLNHYDFIPYGTGTALLVSDRFKELFSLKFENELLFYPTIVFDECDSSINSFWLTKIVHKIDCIEPVDTTNMSEEDIFDMSFDRPKIDTNNIPKCDIVQDITNESIIVVSNKFKNFCDYNKIKGVFFDNV